MSLKLKRYDAQFLSMIWYDNDNKSEANRSDSIHSKYAQKVLIIGMFLTLDLKITNEPPAFYSTYCILEL